MKLLKLGTNGASIIHLQKFLQAEGESVQVNGTFDEFTHQAVMNYQKQNGLVVDGIVGPNTLKVIRQLKRNLGFSSTIRQHPLEPHEYIEEVHPKKTIYLHHTAGRHRPDITIDWWKEKARNRVATAFVIGSIALNDDDTYDGKIYQCFPEHQWAHHLGIKKSNNKQLNKESIGIEICGLGPLEKVEDRFCYVYYVQKNGVKIRKEIDVPAHQVCDIVEPWRGYRYFQKYTPQQIEATKQLLLDLAFQYDIPLPDFEYTRDWFELNEAALAGEAGIWTHVHVRADKTDCFPQPELIDMLNSLHEAQKTFEPGASEFESMTDEVVTDAEPFDYDSEEFEYYAKDLDDVWEE